MKVFQANIQRWFAKAFNLSVLQKSRLAWVDYLRGIAIVLVVYRHVLLGIDRSGIIIPAYLINANMIFYSFRMPLFFILSGIFISASLAKKSVKQLVFIKFENLLYPYFIWAFIQISLQILLSSYTNSSRGLIDYLYMFYQPRNLDQFWYLPALFNTTVIYLLIKTKLKAPTWLQFLLGIGFYFLSAHVQQISMISDWMEFYIFFALGDAISQFFFKQSTQKFLKSGIVLLLLIPVFVATQIYYLANDYIQNRTNFSGDMQFLIIALIGCLCMFVLAFRFQIWNTFKFLRVLGYHSLYIYVIHVIVAGLIRICLTKLFGIHNPAILLFTIIPFAVTIPVIIYNLFIKDNFAWFLFSFQKRKPKAVPANEISPALASS
ncbi:MAG: acyltransferase family protein [Chitinophagaceae bacterium]